MLIKILVLSIILFSNSIMACVPCQEDFKDAQFVSFSEPHWFKNEVPETRIGFVTAKFDIADSGKPFNVNILKIVPETLDKSKLIQSIQNAQFTLYRIDCDQESAMNRKNLTYTFDLVFDNVR